MDVILIALEKYATKAIAVCVGIISICFKFSIANLESYDSLFSNVINFSSILIGAILTIIGLFLGYSNKVVVKKN